MPFVDGVFANIVGATNAAAGETIQSATWNGIHADYSGALNVLADQLANTPSYRSILWMNGGLEIWQRGSGATASISVAASTTSYTADRWYLATDANQASVVSAQAGITTGSNLCARVQRNAAQTGTGTMRFAYPLDTDEVYTMRGKIIRVSFSARAGANWSPTNGTITATLYSGTGAVAKRNATPYTSEVSNVVVTSDLVAGGSTTQISGTSLAVLSTSATQAELQFSWAPTGTAGASDYVEIDDVQIEVVSADDGDDYIPTAFERLPFDVMLQGCKRFFQKTVPYSTAPSAGVGSDNALRVLSQAAELAGFFWAFPVEMRSGPTFSKFHPTTATSSNWFNITSGATVSAAFVTAGSAGTNTKGIMLITSSSVTATGQIIAIHCYADSGI